MLNKITKEYVQSLSNEQLESEFYTYKLMVHSFYGSYTNSLANNIHNEIYSSYIMLRDEMLRRQIQRNLNKN